MRGKSKVFLVLSDGGFILEGDWTFAKINMFYSPAIEAEVLSAFIIKRVEYLQKKPI